MARPLRQYTLKVQVALLDSSTRRPQMWRQCCVDRALSPAAAIASRSALAQASSPHSHLSCPGRLRSLSWTKLVAARVSSSRSVRASERVVTGMAQLYASAVRDCNLHRPAWPIYLMATSLVTRPSCSCTSPNHALYVHLSITHGHSFLENSDGQLSTAIGELKTITHLCALALPSFTLAMSCSQNAPSFFSRSGIFQNVEMAHVPTEIGMLDEHLRSLYVGLVVTLVCVCVHLQTRMPSSGFL